MPSLFGLTNPFENSVYNENLTQLEKEKQIADYVDAVLVQGYTVPIDVIVGLNEYVALELVSPGVIDNFDIVLTEAFIMMEADQFATFTLENLGGLTASQVSLLNPDIFNTLSVDQVTALSPDAFDAITPAQLGALDPAIVQQLQDSGLILAITSDGEENDGDLSTAGFTVSENTTQVTTVTVSSPTTGVDFALLGDDADKFNIDGLGVLSFVTSPDFELPLDLDSDNIYDLTVVATEGAQVDSQFISVTVSDDTSDNNAAPVITSNGGGETTTISLEENSDLVTTVMASDDDQLTYSIDGGDDANKFFIDSHSGDLFFALPSSVTPNFEVPQDADLDNSYNVIVKASDGIASDTQDITINILDDPNDGPKFRTDENYDLFLPENEALGLLLSTYAEDRFGTGSVTYSIVGGADADLFGISGLERLYFENLTDFNGDFRNDPDFEYPLDLDGDNTYEVKIQVSDEGGQSDLRTFTITVENDPNDGPDIFSGGFNNNPSATYFFTENDNTLVTNVGFDDFWGSGLSVLSISGGEDAGKFSLDDLGNLRFKDDPDFENPQDAGFNNIYEVEVQVSDGSQTDSQMIVVEVFNDPSDDGGGPGGPGGGAGTVINADPSVLTYSGVDGERDIFVFDASAVTENPDDPLEPVFYTITNFDQAQDSFVFTNFDLDGDGQLLNLPGDLFINEGSFDESIFVDLSGGSVISIDQFQGPNFVTSVVEIYSDAVGFEPVPLAPPAMPGYAQPMDPLAGSVSFYAEGFDLAV